MLSGLLYKSHIISKGAACLIISIFAIILFGIRSENVGNVDVPRYTDSYKLLQSLHFSQVSNYFNRDIGFYYLSKVFSMLFPSYNMWFTIIGALFIFNVSTLIRKFSNQLILSYIIFFTFTFTLNFSLLRHCCALAFVISGYIALKEDKSKKAIFLILLATFFHLSAIIAFLMIPLKKLKFGLWNFMMIIAAVFISLFVKTFLSDLILLLNMDRLDYYVKNDVMTLTMTAFIINSFFLAVILYLISLRPKECKEKYSFELNLFSVGVALYALVVVLAEFYRTAMFFSFVLIILLPNVLNEFRTSKYKKLIPVGELVIGVLLLFYFFFITLVNHELIPFEVNSII